VITHGADLVRIFHPSHPYNGDCAGCAAVCSTTAMVSLVYTFERCDCPHAPYVHLVERLWHRGCFVASERAS
jgi:hypothetical protein